MNKQLITAMGAVAETALRTGAAKNSHEMMALLRRKFPAATDRELCEAGLYLAAKLHLGVDPAAANDDRGQR